MTRNPISNLTAVGSVHRANRDSDGQVIKKCSILKPILFVDVRKSKISITDLYEFIRHMNECQVDIVEQYVPFLLSLTVALLSAK